VLKAVCGIFAAVAAGLAQETAPETSFSIPITISGGAMYTQRLQSSDPNAIPGAAAFRTMFYPTLKLGSHWFAYAAVQVRSMPYFYYDAYDTDRQIYTDVIQAFVGYSFRHRKFSMIVKAGQLSSAFGSFPLRYDDTENPLIDQPLSYVTQLPLQADDLPRGARDLQGQSYGSSDSSEGIRPVTLYGLAGIEADISAGRVDARLQITNGSPAAPQGFNQPVRYIQWTAGGGYTIRQGFRVGISAFRGPYLNSSVTAALPPGTSIRDFPATGIGVDAQWARGHWTTTGEWHRFQFDLPGFVTSPAVASGYGEVKRIVTPRFYVAGRAGYLNTGSVRDGAGITAGSFAPALHSYEFGGGAYLSRSVLVKASYAFLRVDGTSGPRNDVFGVQLVASIRSLGWALK